MRLRNRTIPQAGTGAPRDGESRPGPSGSGCPSYSGEGNESYQTAQYNTDAEQRYHPSPSSSPTLSLFSSTPSSPQSYADIHELRSSSSSSPSTSFTSSPIRAEDVVQEATTAKVTAPVEGSRRIRKTWTKDMNIFIMRHYFILTKIETNLRSYLTPLHSLFTTKYPEMDACKQRIGDQRRAITYRNLLTKQEILDIKEEAKQFLKNQEQLPDIDSNLTLTQTSRMQWSCELNELIMKSYYRITRLETDLTTYRPLLHQEIIAKCPELSHLSAQRIADQRRTIVHNKLLPVNHLNRIKEEVRIELETNSHTHLIEETETEANTVNAQSPIPTTDNRHEITPIIPNYNRLNPQNVQPRNTHAPALSPEMSIQLDDMLTKNIKEFKEIDPTKRPHIPKLKTSKKLSITISHLNTTTIPNILNSDTDFNTLQTIIYSTAYTIAKFIGAKINKETNRINKITKTPWWQRRLEARISKLRANIGRLTEYIRGVRSSKLDKHIHNIKQQFKIHAQHETQNTDISHYLDTLKQKLNTLTNRLRRYRETTNRKTQNKQFKNNEKLFYRKLSQQETNDSTENKALPNPQMLREFWSQIWSTPIEHKQNYWLEDEKEKLKDLPEMKFENISLDLLKNIITKTHNWKATGSDNIHNFWYKKLTCTHDLLHQHINKFIHFPDKMPEYITQGITFMIPKDSKDTQNPAKYRPITCLQNIYKIITSCLTDSIYKHTQEHNILAEEQKGCRKHSQGCKEQLTIDAVASNQALKEKRNIHTMFIDYKKAFDSVPHSWLIYILKHYRIHPHITSFLESIMPRWTTKLKIGTDINNTTETDFISIRRGIFQGDALSPLWFCLALNPLSSLLNTTGKGFTIKHNSQQTSLTHLMYMDDIKLFANTINDLHILADRTQTFSNDICMEFGVDKCNIQSINKGKIEQTLYELQNQEVIRSIDQAVGYKYLGYNQTKTIHHKETKIILREKFKSRIHKILHTHLNSQNTTKAINTFAIPILTYSFGIIKWSKTDLKTLQTLINTTLTKHRKHHPRSCVQRLTLPKIEGGRGIIDITNLHNKQITLLRKYFYNRSQESPIHNAVCQSDTFTPLLLTDQTKQITIISNQHKIDIWAQKSLHGRHRTDLTSSNVDKVASNAWLKRGELFPETEGFLIGIQDQVIDTKNYRKHIIRDNAIGSDHCRHCHRQPETIQHITGACSSITQTDYKHRHDQVAAIIHQTLALKHNLITDKTPYYKYTPKIILDSPHYKLYWDRTILTDKTVHHNRPDITLHDKQNKTVFLIDIAIPNTHNLTNTHTNKLTKYTDLTIEIKSQWKVNIVKIIPIIISTTGVIPKTLHTSLKTLNIHPLTYITLQKAAILNTCRIVRKFLSIND